MGSVDEYCCCYLAQLNQDDDMSVHSVDGQISPGADQKAKVTLRDLFTKIIQEHWEVKMNYFSDLSTWWHENWSHFYIKMHKTS